MKVQNAYSHITLAQVTDLVAAIGDKVTVLVTGPMGCGKSSILKELAVKFPDYHHVYVEAQLRDLGDFQMPKFKNLDGTDVVGFVPNEEFGTHLKKPIILMLDEIGKASKTVKNGLLRVMLERKIGIHSLPEGSIVFATTNRASEGVGDVFLPHERNRMCQADVTKESAMAWVENWAIKNGIHPVVIGTVLEFPSMFEDDIHVEDPNSNHYINHPKTQRAAFVTHRSMAMASDILKATEHLSDSVIVHALMGTVGEAAAMDLLTMRKLNNDLPTWEQIMKAPATTQIPKSGAACCMLVAKACMRIERETFEAWMEYVERMPKEVAALFAKTIMRSEKKGIAATHKVFISWAAQNSFLFS